MDKFPFGIALRGFLHGFSALYGLFIIGFLFVFAMSFLLSGLLSVLIMVIGLLGFLAFCILGVILKTKNPDIFLVNVGEEYHLNIAIEGSKTPDGEVNTSITKLGKPEKHPQINKGRE